MTEEDIHDLFEKHNDEFLKFDRIENKRSSRPDIHAFLLLNELCPLNRDIVCSASHDQIWLDPDAEDVCNKATVDQVIELIRCGVFYDEDNSSFSMFV
jgi:hypothetical protein